MMTAPTAPDRKRLVKVSLDETTMGANSRDIEHERAIAIYDLLEDNSFAPVGHDEGPYCLALQVVENRLVFDIRTENGTRNGRSSPGLLASISLWNTKRPLR